MLERINSRLDDTEGQISELKTVVEITQFEQKEKEKIMRTMEETSETTSRIVPLALEKSQKEEETDEEAENVFEDIISFSNP